MVKRQNLDALADTIDEYDAESREYFQALKFSEIQIGKINTMKATPGWKVLEKKIREELIDRINILTKDDAEVKVLLRYLLWLIPKHKRKRYDKRSRRYCPRSSYPQRLYK
jgi:hypothetical protein